MAQRGYTLLVSAALALLALAPLVAAQEPATSAPTPAPAAEASEPTPPPPRGAAAATIAPKPEDSAWIAAALDDLAAGVASEGRTRLEAEFAAGARPASAWHPLLREYLAARPFAPGIASYFAGAIPSAGARASNYGAVAVVYAAEALGASDEPASIAAASALLDQLAILFAGAAAEAIATALDTALSAQPLQLEAAWAAPERPYEVETARTLAQAGLTVANHVTRSGRAALLSVPPHAAPFLAKYGILLFDNHALNPAQLASLDSLYAAVPRELHSVAALFVPEAAGFGAGAAWRTPLGLLDVAPIPMSLFVAPEEFTPGTHLASAPQFTAEAMAQLVRAVQAQQFALRPELLERRDRIIATAGPSPARYLRQTLPPAAYFSTPEGLLPAVAYLWVVDSTAAFGKALALLALQQGPAMDSLLLLADVFSGGSGQALVFQTSLAGEVAAQPTALRRTPLAPQLAYCTGLAIGGDIFAFNLNGFGSVEPPHGGVAYLP